MSVGHESLAHWSEPKASSALKITRLVKLLWSRSSSTSLEHRYLRDRRALAGVRRLRIAYASAADVDVVEILTPIIEMYYQSGKNIQVINKWKHLKREMSTFWCLSVAWYHWVWQWHICVLICTLMGPVLSTQVLHIVKTNMWGRGCEFRSSYSNRGQNPQVLIFFYLKIFFQGTIYTMVHTIQTSIII